MDSDRIVIGGYSFSYEMGIAARKEKTAIEVISKRLDMDKPETVFEVYKQIISQKLFHTPVGYDFLKGLQNYLITNPMIDNAQIEKIEIDSPQESMDAILATANKQSSGKGKKKPKGALDGKYKKKASIFMITTIVLGLCVIAMFAITLTANVPTILNYKTVLNDQYSQWEQELTIRENALNEMQKGMATPSQTDETTLGGLDDEESEQQGMGEDDIESFTIQDTEDDSAGDNGNNLNNITDTGNVINN